MENCNKQKESWKNRQQQCNNEGKSLDKDNLDELSDEVVLINGKNSRYRGSGPQFEPVNINLNEDFRCDQFSKIFESQGLLNSHLESHRQRIFKCKTGDIGFKEDADLNNHIVEHETDKTIDKSEDKHNNWENFSF